MKWPFYPSRPLQLQIMAKSEFRSRSWSRPEPGYLSGAGAVTLARLRLWLLLEYLFNNSQKWNLTSFDVFSNVNIKYDLHVLVHMLERILDNS